MSRPKRKPAPAESESGSGADPELRLSPHRTWLFRIVAILLIPLVSLALLEAALRLAGFGFPTNFFLKRKISGKIFLTENDRFGERFFPQRMARSPAPMVLEPDKPVDCIRIFVFGESAALGDPEPAFGFSRFLQVLLQDRFPKVRFEVVCTAMTAINSHVVLPITRDCSSHQGDIWIVYMGNNEFVGPYGPSTVFGPKLPPLSAIRFAVAARKTRLGQLLSRVFAAPLKQQNWAGMKMFLEGQIAPLDPRKTTVYAYTRANLEDILAAAREARTKVLLSTVAVNLKDCPPFASEHGTSDQLALSAWRESFDLGVRLQNSGDHFGAATNFQAAARLDPAFAELQFRWAQCLLGSSNAGEAKIHFELARDFDALPFRADASLNHLIRDVAQRHASENIRLVDTESALGAHAASGVPGSDLFFEHVHLNFEGNYHVALELAENVVGFLPDAIQRDRTPSWASFEVCSRKLALTSWDRRRVYDSLLRRLQEPPFVGQLLHAAKIEALRQDIARERALCTSPALANARETYLAAIRQAPDDLYLHANFAKLDEDTDNPGEAAAQWTAVRDQIPFAPGPHYYLGKVLSAAGKREQALTELDAALAIRPAVPEVLEEKGRTLIQANQADQGLRVLQQAAELDPANARICVETAQALASLGRRSEALPQLQKAVQLQPSYWEAHYLWGVELAFEGNIAPAATQFSDTVRLNPSFALGHLNLGIALAKLNRVPEAMTQFEETLRLDPHNQKASEYLQALSKPTPAQR